MILQLFIGLLGIALASLLITQGRRRKIWSVLILTTLVLLSYFFADNLSSNLQEGFIYQWLPYSEIRSDFHIASTIHLQKMFLPLILLLTGAVYFNIIYLYENHSLHISVLFILSFVSLILQISSNDFLQLMFASCMFSIIGFYIPDLIQAKKRMFIFNFLAEMSVFMALSIVYGKNGSTDIADLPRFAEDGIHKDLVASLLMLAIACKCGFFLVNSQYLILKNITFNRACGLMVLSIPLSGIVLMTKLHPLLNMSYISSMFLPVWAFTSVIIGGFNAMINNNLQSRFISLCLAFYAFLVFIFCRHDSNIYNLIPYFLTSQLLIAAIFMQIIYSSSYVFSIAHISTSWRNSKPAIFNICFLVLALISLFTSKITVLESKIFILFLMIIIAGVLKSVYIISENKAHEQKLTLSELIYCIISVCISFIIIYKTKGWKNPLNIYDIMAFILSFIIFPAKKTLKIGQSEIWQKDYLSHIYERFFIYPLKFLGRVLWLAFDIVVIERSIISGITHLNKAIVTSFHKYQENQKYGWIWGILLGITFVLIYLGVSFYD